MAAKIKKGDKVVVMTGRDKGKTGEVRQGMPRMTTGDRGRRQSGAPSYAPDRADRGRHPDQGGADPPVKIGDRRSEVWQADARSA